MLPTLRNRNFLPGFVDDFFGRDILSSFFDNKADVTVPAVNVIENSNEYKIEVAAPGLGKKDFKVDVHNNILVISSEKEVNNEENNDKYVRKEFAYSSFKRSFGLPEEVDVDRIKASHKDGVLEIQIPKREEAKEKPPREIKIA